MVDNNVLKVDAVEGRPSQIVYEAQSGVIFHITPLNLPTLRAIQLKAEELFSYPDKEPYQIPDPAEVAFDAGQTSKAEDHPEYISLCKVKDTERKQWVDKAIFSYAAQMPKYPTHDDLINAFRPQLNALRQIATLPADDYEAILLHLVLTWNLPANDGKTLSAAESEYTRIILLAIQTVALSASEVANGIRFFRPQISGR